VALMSGVSMLMNFRFGYGFGANPLDAWIYGLAGAAADCLKPLLPLVLVAAFREGEHARAIVAAVLLVACVVYSVVSALGFVAFNRVDTMHGRTARAESYQRMRRELGDAERQLAALGRIRPVGLVEADIAERLGRTGARGRSGRTVGQITKGCTVRSRLAVVSRACDDVAKLRLELAAAKEATALRLKTAALGRELGRIAGTSGGGGDPQVSLLQELTGLGERQIQLALALSMALLVELMSGLGLFALTQSRQSGTNPPAPATVPAMPPPRARGLDDEPSPLRIPDLRL
ncbi:MAG: hypothetical protein KDA45_16800, partial [Planctomycetales bacterium]|nr:hypothetical protein [Planctomycetales bacterium]